VWPFLRVVVNCKEEVVLLKENRKG